MNDAGYKSHVLLFPGAETRESRYTELATGFTFHHAHAHYKTRGCLSTRNKHIGPVLVLHTMQNHYISGVSDRKASHSYSSIKVITYRHNIGELAAFNFINKIPPVLLQIYTFKVTLLANPNRMSIQTS